MLGTGLTISQNVSLLLLLCAAAVWFYVLRQPRGTWRRARTRSQLELHNSPSDEFSNSSSSPGRVGKLVLQRRSTHSDASTHAAAALCPSCRVRAAADWAGGWRDNGVRLAPRPALITALAAALRQRGANRHLRRSGRDAEETAKARISSGFGALPASARST